MNIHEKLNDSFLKKLFNIDNDKYCEIDKDTLQSIDEKDYERIFERYEKIFINDVTESHNQERLYHKLFSTIDTSKIYPIVDGFADEFCLEKIYPNIPRQNIFLSPIFCLWYEFNVIFTHRITTIPHIDKWYLSDRLKPSSKINLPFLKLIDNNIDNLINEYSTDRKFKFIFLNRNMGGGREICIDRLSDNFLKENWVSAGFAHTDKERGYPYDGTNTKPYKWYLDKTESERERFKYLRRDNFVDYENDNTGWSSCYEIIWKEHYNKAYFQIYWETSSWTEPALHCGQSMLTEKTMIPFLMGNLPIPMNIFYVDYLEKIGFKFIKKIGDVEINKSISQSDFIEPGPKTANKISSWYDKQMDCLNAINKYSLNDIKDIYVKNFDMVEHNRDLMRNYCIDDNILNTLEEWIQS